MTDTPPVKKKRKSVPRPYAAKNKKPLPPGVSSLSIRVTAEDAVLETFRKLKAQERGALIKKALET
ncbi:MAG: hypothetical protein HC933_12790 [Pleurocapsa sp. SU_196_0]|nr:hypothetical protein [Pleurocapsa sp. SU_196_0]